MNKNLINYKLYDKPLPSTRGGALYNTFSYPTKISPETISLFIASHTNPGDTILDTFSGSGTTGLAALLCDKPNEKMLSLAKEYDLNPKWGPRKAILSEIGVIGSFISNTMCNPPEPKLFNEVATDLLKRANESLNELLIAYDNEGNVGRIRYVIWSDVLICPSCNNEVTFWDLAASREPLEIKKVCQCSRCNESINSKDAKEVFEEVYDEILQKNITRKKRKIAYVYGQTGTKKWHRTAIQSDLDTFNLINNFSLPIGTIPKKIKWGDLHRKGYHSGITHLHHFYTKRNFIVLSTLWNLISDYPENLRDSLKMLILSYNSSHSTLMTRIVVKKNQKDFSITGAQPGVLYVSSLPVEKNIIDGLKRKVKTFTKAFTEVYDSESTVDVINGSSRSLNIEDNSINYVFTDPPFGDFIPYSELNQINELWLNKLTDQSEEVIINKSQEKNIITYKEMMKDVFKEINRVLVPDGKATVVFHSSKAEVWKALIESYMEANFKVEHTSVLDKLQSSFKQTVSNVSVKGDPLILLNKHAVENTPIYLNEDELFILLMKENIKNKTKKEDIQKLYSIYISKCIKNDIEISLDASSFIKKVKQWSEKNDG